jgi:two-component system, NtrC family, C4-dicarboxylate transport sensor histidine kinase DctB
MLKSIKIKFNYITGRFANNWLTAFAVAVIVALSVSWVSVQLGEMQLRKERRILLHNEINRRALDLMSQTAKSNVMGGITLLGVVADSLKPPARNEMKKVTSEVREILASTAQGVKSDNTFIVAGNGIIVIDNPRGAKSAVGLNVGFRPYFRQAMQKKPNVYAAVSVSTGERGLYFTAPIHSDRTQASPAIGAISVRISPETVDSLLDAWRGPALLLSPQGVVFSANRREWLLNVRQGLTSEEYAAIKREKQFGSFFDKESFQRIPFAIDAATTEFAGRRHAVEKAALAWNDPLGDWMLVLMEDQSQLLTSDARWKIALAGGSCALMGVVLVLVWIRRLNRVTGERELAQQSLKEYAKRIEASSAAKTHMAEISADLQKTTTFEELARVFMSQAIPLLEVHYGVLYILNRDNDLLLPVGGYGFTGGGDAQDTFAMGQGLVGQCALERKPITITDATDTGIFIDWGMGKAVPTEILLHPLVQKEQAVGVLEMASAGAFPEVHRQLLDELAATLAMNIEILDRNVRTRSLLGATREQAEMLQEQAEKLQEQQAALSEASRKSEEANQALQKQVEELAHARRAMMNIMEDLEASRLETETRNLQTQKLLDETSQQAEKLREQQAQIKETEAWYHGIIESAPDGMLVIDEKGLIILTNKMVEDMFGYGPGELRGENVDRLVAASVRGRHEALREGFMQKGLSRQFDSGLNLQGARKDNTEFPVEIGLSMLSAMGARGRCVCASIRDITERKRIEEELKQQMDELERFTQLTIDREERMIDLKEEINAMLMRTGQEAKYKIVE